MNKEELLNKYIDLIDKGYCSDCNELNCIDNFPHAKITHAIREVQQENQELKKQLEEYKDNYNCLLKQKEQFEYIMSKQVDYLGQKKEFINYMNGVIDVLKKEDVYDEELRGYIIQRIDTFKEILQKYKEIIGGNDDKK